jgi:hypothetical protein
MVNDILAGVPWGIFLSFMIGPVFFILLETSILKGFRAIVLIWVLFWEILYLSELHILGVIG